MRKIDLLKLISLQLHTLRTVFTDAGCTEVITPSLEANGFLPFQKPIKVAFDGRDALLTVSPDPYLAEAAAHAERVFSISNAFRAEDPSLNRLLEFRYAQAWLPGVLGDATYLVERIFTRFLSALAIGRMISAERLNELRQVSIPFRKVTYLDALRMVGKTTGDHLDHANHLQLCQLSGDKPIFLIEFPPEEQPLAFDSVQREVNQNTVLEYFELITPYSGETGNGRQIETRESQYKVQFGKSLFASELARLGAPCAHVDIHADLLKGFTEPLVVVGIGLERMLQFFIAANSIEESVLFPITSDHLPDMIFACGSGRG